MMPMTNDASLGGRVLGTLLKRRKSYPQDREAGTTRDECETGLIDERLRRLFKPSPTAIHFFSRRLCKPFQTLRNPTRNVARSPHRTMSRSSHRTRENDGSSVA